MMWLNLLNKAQIVPPLPLLCEVHHTVSLRLALDQNTLDEVKGRCSHVSLFYQLIIFAAENSCFTPNLNLIGINSLTLVFIMSFSDRLRKIIIT